jgi:ABC-2 type transport system permease protein
VIRALVARNLRHHARLLVSLLVGFALLELLLCAIAAQIDAGPGLENLIEQFMPPMFRTLFGAQIGIASFDGMLAFGFQHPAILTAAVAFVIVVGTLSAGERESGLLDLLLARPVPRRAYFAAQLLTLVVGVLVLPIGLLIGLVLGLEAVAVEGALPWRRFLPAAASAAALLLSIGGYTLLIGAASQRRGPAVARAAGLTLALYFLDFLAALWAPLAPVAWLSPFHYHEPMRAAVLQQATGGRLAVLFGLFVAGSVAAWQVFRRRDL